MPRPTMSDHALELLSISCTFHSKDDPGQRYTAVADTTLRIRVFGKTLEGVNARAGYMFQTEALMPWRSAIDNVMVG
eukprot:gene63142-86374_t